MGRDATVVIEGEMRQFDKFKPGPTHADHQQQRFVEILATGDFRKVQKDI